MPILYEARLPELAIEGPETLDRLYEAMFGDQPPEVQEQIRRRYANKETVAEAERRIEMIALDISEHFKSKIRPNGFKAQVVAPSRRAALRYAEYLNNFGLRAYPIITTTSGDGPEFRIPRELEQEQITSAFVDPNGEPEALVVVDMLLTGFDAPRGASAVPGPGPERARPAPSHCPGEPQILPRVGRGRHRQVRGHRGRLPRRVS